MGALETAVEGAVDAVMETVADGVTHATENLADKVDIEVYSTESTTCSNSRNVSSGIRQKHIVPSTAANHFSRLLDRLRGHVHVQLH